ncbi:MAG: hypothetical protein RRY54_06700 [Angelakisella sp.]
MKKSGFELTMVSVLVIIISIGLAAILSGLTPKGDVIPSEEESSSSRSETIDEETATDGGIKGGNKDAVRSGRLPGHEDKAVNSDPDRFFYSLNSHVVLDSPDAEGSIMLENNPGNVCPLQLCYYLEDTEEPVYISPLLAPDEHIETDKLTKKLKKGEYKINAVISVYDDETLELKTTYHEEVKLTVNQKLLGIF